MQILKVVFPLPLRKEFDYLAPEKASASLQIGLRVKANFGNRVLIGIITAINAKSDFDIKKLKHLIEVLDDTPLFTTEDLNWLNSIAKYYHASFGDLLFLALPKLLRQGKELFSGSEKVWRLTNKAQQNLNLEDFSRSPKQQQALKILQENPQGLNRNLLKGQGIDASILKKLEQKHLAVEDYALSHFGIGLPEVPKTPSPISPANILFEVPPELNTEQKHALQQIKSALNRFEAFLLLGITGSGKTEVYLQAIHQCLLQGKQALLLVPEINLTPQTLTRFTNRFNCTIAVMHSGLTDNARLKAYRQAKDGRAKIVIGTRSAIFTPLQNPGLILLDEEQDTSFKQQDNIRYQARDIALSLAKRWDVPIVFGSATPSLDSLQRAQKGVYTLLRLNQRHTKQKNAPTPQLFDISKQKLQAGISPDIFGKIEQHLKNGNQVLLALNRRGFAPLLKCLSCNWQADCPNCDASLIYHQSLDLLWCHHCDFKQAVPTTCSVCGNDKLASLGVGTEKTEQFLANHFSDYPVIRIDRDTTKGKNLYAKLDEVNQNQASILIGTQMLAKGHHFPKVSLAVILDADFGLLSSDPYALEKTAQLIIQVAGRAGRGDTTGEVIVQTAYPEDFRLLNLCKYGYEHLCREILQERQPLGYPPFGFQALFRVNSLELNYAQILASQIADLANMHPIVQNGEVICFGAMPAPMEKRQNRYHIQVLLQSTKRSKLHTLVEFILLNVENSPAIKNARLGLDIDPIDLF